MTFEGNPYRCDWTTGRGRCRSIETEWSVSARAWRCLTHKPWEFHDEPCLGVTITGTDDERVYGLVESETYPDVQYRAWMTVEPPLDGVCECPAYNPCKHVYALSRALADAGGLVKARRLVRELQRPVREALKRDRRGLIALVAEASADDRWLLARVRELAGHEIEEEEYEA